MDRLLTVVGSIESLIALIFLVQGFWLQDPAMKLGFSACGLILLGAAAALFLTARSHSKERAKEQERRLGFETADYRLSA